MASKLPAGFFDSKPARTSTKPSPQAVPAHPQKRANTGIGTGKSAILQSSGKVPEAFIEGNGAGTSPGGSKRPPPTRGTGAESAHRGQKAAPVESFKAASSGRAAIASKGKVAGSLANSTPPSQAQKTANATPATGRQAGRSGPSPELPEGFFDDIDADSKARGVEVKKLDIR